MLVFFFLAHIHIKKLVTWQDTQIFKATNLTVHTFPLPPALMHETWSSRGERSSKMRDGVWLKQGEQWQLVGRDASSIYSNCSVLSVLCRSYMRDAGAQWLRNLPADSTGYVGFQSRTKTEALNYQCMKFVTFKLQDKDIQGVSCIIHNTSELHM